MILITGASGFIGRTLLDAYGNNATGLQRSVDENDERIFACDLTSEVNVDEVINKLKEFSFSHIIHTAAVTPWSTNPDFSQDMLMAEAVSKIAVDLNIPKVIFVSGWNVYDMSKDEPPFSEETPINPVGKYAKSKYEVEQYLAQQQANFSTLSIRAASIYGVGQISTGLITNLVQSAIDTQAMHLKSLNTKRDYLYIDDFVNLITEITRKPDIFDEGVFNAGSGRSVSVIELAETVRDIWDEKYHISIKIYPDENLEDSAPIDNELDIRKAQAKGLLLKTTPIKEGLSQYIEWKKK